MHRRDFEILLRCGRLEYGFLRLRCERCHAERLLERDTEQAWLNEKTGDSPMAALWAPAITYRIAVGPHQGAR